MTVSVEYTQSRDERGSVWLTTSAAGGILLIALAVLALWLTHDLDQGTLNAMGPAMLPRRLAIAVGLSGFALLAFAFIKEGDAMERWNLRGPVFVIGGILAFALTLRPFALGGALTTPGLGMLFAGPLAIIIGGYATPEARLRDLVILALSLTPFCMILFGDLLNLPIPVFPQALTGLFPADWSQKAVLRATAGIMAIAGILVFLVSRGRRRGPVDVADHSGRI
jgi:hypothetical protein